MYLSAFSGSLPGMTGKIKYRRIKLKWYDAKARIVVNRSGEETPAAPLLCPHA